jgi:hypothetical protein
MQLAVNVRQLCRSLALEKAYNAAAEISNLYGKENISKSVKEKIKTRRKLSKKRRKLAKIIFGEA